MNFSALKELLETKPKIVITTHQSPDGDAIGSSLALYIVLKKLDFDTSFIVPNAMADFLKWLPFSNEAIIFDENKEDAQVLLKESELIFCLDFNDLARTGLLEGPLKKGDYKFALIDHHLNPKKFAHFVLSDSTASSTAELIYLFLNEMNWGGLIDANIAKCIYTGILTDTGSFRFPSTTSDTHAVVSQLLEYNIEHEKIHEFIYDSYSENRLKLLGHCLLNQYNIIDEHQVSYMYVTKQDHIDFNILKGDTEGIVNYNLLLPNIKMGVFFTEDKDLIKISFRSKGDYPANLFAEKYFNGGGHKNAAGGRSRKSLSKTIEYFKKCLDEFENTI